LWKVPTRGDGQIDTDIMYDIWLVDDPNLIDNPPEGRKIASNISMGSSNYVISGDTVIGYKYVVSNLTPNSTYYLTGLDQPASYQSWLALSYRNTNNLPKFAPVP